MEDAAASLDLLRAAGSHPIVSGFPEGAIIVFDRQYRYLCAGGHGLETVGLTRAMIEGRTIHEVFPPSVAATLERSYDQVLAGHEVTIEIPFGDRTFLHRVSPLPGSDGTVLAGIGFALDVSVARRAEKALRESEEYLREQQRRLQDAEAIGNTGSWEWDAATDVITWSDGLFALHSLDPAQFHGGYPESSARIHADDRPMVDLAMETCSRSDQPVRFRYRVARAGDGELRWFECHARGVFHEGRLVRRVGAIADISETVLAQEQLAHDALHDGLTGLPNRSLLLDRLDAAVIRSRRNGREVAVLYCDLDGFKRVNDTAGHAAGDAVLAETARRLRRAVRQDDTVARVGGDEFVIIVEPWSRNDDAPTVGAPSHSAGDRMLSLAVADRVVRELRRPIEVEGVRHQVSLSIGITYPSLLALDDGTVPTSTEILNEADMAMYHAKRLGKDRFEVFQAGLTELSSLDEVHL